MFCAGYNPYFFRYVFPLNSDDFSVRAFFLQLHFMPILQHFYGLFYHLIIRDISLKSQETFVHFSVMFHLTFIEFCLFNFSSDLPFLSYSICIRLFIRIFVFVYLFGYNYSFIHPYTYWFSSLSYLLSCLAFLFIYLFRVLCFVKLC